MASRFRLNEPMTNWKPHNIFLPLPEIRERFEHALKVWFDLRCRCWGAIVPYFANRRTPAPFSEDRFFSYARAAESLHRNLRADEKILGFGDDEWEAIRKAMMNVVPKQRRNIIGLRLRHFNELTYLDRLSRIMGRFPSLSNDVVGDAPAQRKFAHLVKELRNREAHQLDRGQTADIDGSRLERIAAKLWTLIDAWLLAEIGIADDQIDRAMRNNCRYWHYASNRSWPWSV